MPIDVATFGASVGTSVLTAFVVEQWVKPRVEATKERRNTQRAFMAVLVRLSLSAGVLAEELPEDMTDEVRERVRGEQARQEERLNLAAMEIFDSTGTYAAVYNGPLRQLLVDYVACVHGLMLSTRSKARKAQILKELAVPIATALDPERQRLRFAWGNARALQAAARIITGRHSDQRKPLDHQQSAQPAMFPGRLDQHECQEQAVDPDDTDHAPPASDSIGAARSRAVGVSRGSE